jgi:arsenate reductase
MNNILFHLSTCNTCQRIIQETGAAEKLALQDIKTESISPDQIDAMKNLAGSYEALFSRRAMKFRSMGLHEQELNEEDYRKHILAEYTFLKRPVAIVNGEIFVGNSKKVVAQLAEALK